MKISIPKKLKIASALVSVAIVTMVALFGACADLNFYPSAERLSSTSITQTDVLPKTTGILKIHFIDVGQGDSIFLELPNGKTMLIDAGDTSSGVKIVNYIKALGYDKIDYLVATHPHEDHIGGMPYVLSSLNVGEVWAPKVIHTTRTYENFLDAVEESGLSIRTAEKGKTIVADEKLTVEVLSPIAASYSDLNNWSAVLFLSFDKTTYLFTGDANKNVILLAYNAHVDVLKVGHHGSYTSTDAALVSALTPTYSVISCGIGNSYGHPTEEALQALESSNVYRTDLQGTIVAESNGVDIIFSVSAVTYVVPKTLAQENNLENDTLISSAQSTPPA